MNSCDKEHVLLHGMPQNHFEQTLRNAPKNVQEDQTRNILHSQQIADGGRTVIVTLMKVFALILKSILSSMFISSIKIRTKKIFIF